MEAILTTTNYKFHICKAVGCDTRVAQELIMCKKHWFKLPPKMQKDLSDNFRRNVAPTAESKRVLKIAQDFIQKHEAWEHIE